MFLRKFHENARFGGHGPVYKCIFGVNWCKLLFVYCLMMGLFVFQCACFLSFCSHYSHSFMSVPQRCQGRFQGWHPPTGATSAQDLPLGMLAPRTLGELFLSRCWLDSAVLLSLLLVTPTLVRQVLSSNRPCFEQQISKMRCYTIAVCRQVKILLWKLVPSPRLRCLQGANAGVYIVRSHYPYAP